MKTWSRWKTGWIAPGIFLLLVVIQGCGGCGGCGARRTGPTRPRDEPLPRLEMRVEDLSSQIAELQKKIRDVLMRTIKQVEDGNIDSEAEIVRVNNTIKELRLMRTKIQKQMGPAPGPMT